MEKRLYRSTTDRYLGGVCGGLGEYFGVDPAIIRIIALLLIFAHGIGVIAYLVMWIAVRKRPANVPVTAVSSHGEFWSRYFPGGLLILLGVIFFISTNWHWLDLHEIFERFWPLILVAIGLALIWRKRATAKRPKRNCTAMRLTNTTEGPSYDSGEVSMGNAAGSARSSAAASQYRSH
jgi:phage shock protein PspC (stress-responsive transcriptional regulator)